MGICQWSTTKMARLLHLLTRARSLVVGDNQAFDVETTRIMCVHPLKKKKNSFLGFVNINDTATCPARCTRSAVVCPLAYSAVRSAPPSRSASTHSAYPLSAAT